MAFDLKNGNCLVEMKSIPDTSVDLILTDLPYGTTACKWDIIIPFVPMWKEFNRILKKNGVVVLTARQPFTSALIMSNKEMFRYDWIWEKTTPSDFLNCSYKPLYKTESILVFSNGTIGSLSKNPIRYYPQGVIPVNKVKKNNPNSTWRKNKGYAAKGNKLNSTATYTQKYTNYPTNIIKFAGDTGLHPTQKPVALMEYLIKTYTKEGETVLDCCMGSGTTGVACKNTNRAFIGIEMDVKYFTLAKKRIEAI